MHGIFNVLKYSNQAYYTYNESTIRSKSKVVTCTPRRHMGALSIVPINFNIGSRGSFGVRFTAQPL